MGGEGSFPAFYAYNGVILQICELDFKINNWELQLMAKISSSYSSSFSILLVELFFFSQVEPFHALGLDAFLSNNSSAFARQELAIKMDWL